MNPHTPTGPQQGSVHDEVHNSQPQLKGEEGQKEEIGGLLQHDMLVGSQLHQGNEPVGNFYFNPNFLQNQGYGFKPEIPMGVGINWNSLHQSFTFMPPSDLFNQPMQSYTPFDFMQSLSCIPQQQRVLSWDNMSARRQEAELALRLRSPTGHHSQYMRMDNFVPSSFVPLYPPPSPYPNTPALMDPSNSGQIYPPEQQTHSDYYCNNLPTTAICPLVHGPNIPTPTYSHGNAPHYFPLPAPVSLPGRPQADSIPKARGATILPQNLISTSSKSESPIIHKSLFQMTTAGRGEVSSPCDRMSDISLSIPSSNQSPPKASPTLQGLAPRKKVSREEKICLGCGKVGHQMMDCVAECGHCGQEGHRTIYCKYRTLQGEQLALQVALTKSRKEKLQTEKVRKNDMRRERENWRSTEMRDIKQERRSCSPDQKRQYQSKSMMAYDSPRVKEEEHRNELYAGKQPYTYQKEQRQFGYKTRENSPILERQSGFRERDYSLFRDRQRVRGSWGEVLAAPKDARTPGPVPLDGRRRERLVLNKNGK